MSDRDTIKILSTRQQCRDKISIWFGSRENIIHPFKEILANSIDEINNNFDNGEIIIKLKKDKTISVTDTGRGIPIDGKTNEILNYELLFLKLFAGTNYDNGIYEKVTTGTNGCGTCVINHTSSYFNVKSYRKDLIASITFKNGGEIAEPLKVIKKQNNNLDNFTGTTIEFRLDEEVFGNYEYNIDEIKSIIKSSAGVNNKIKFKFQYEGEEELSYYYSNLEDYFIEITNNNTCKPIIGKKTEYKTEIQVQGGENMALQGTSEPKIITEVDNIELILTTSSEPVQKSYLNITHLPEGGTINRGIINGVRDFVNKYAESKRLLDNRLGKLTSDDVEGSISFVCSLLSTVVEFTNQTKLSTNKSLYLNIAKKYVQEVLEVELIENPRNIDKLVKHILEIQKFNNKAKTARKNLRKKLNEKVDNLNNRIEKLTDCEIKGKNAELFICEGDSAKGSIVLARDASFQAVIAIRGKIMNTLKKSYLEIFESQTVMDIMRSLGCGIETDKANKDLGEFNEDNLNYGKIILATDADPDGFQIQCLLLSLFYRLTPKLIENGHIYIALTPLYEVKLKDDSVIYWFSEEEKEKYILENGYSNISVFSRCKGLGELDAEVMSTTGVNPETRNIIQVTVEDAKMMDDMFNIWMCDNSAKRKELLEQQLNKFDVEV